MPTWSVAVYTPELLRPERACVVPHPVVIETREEDQVGRYALLEALDGGLVVVR